MSNKLKISQSNHIKDNKKLEQELINHLIYLEDIGYDKDMLHIATEHIISGMMWMNRAVSYKGVG